MFRAMFYILCSLFIYSGCLPDFPQVGTVQKSDTDNINPTDTIDTDTISHTDTVTTTDSTTDTTILNETSNPPLSQFRPCTDDTECINSEIEGTYYCSDGGLCVSDPRPCTVNEECDDDNVCNGTEACWYGSCYLGPRLHCDDNNILTGQDCHPETGCKYWPINNCLKDENCPTGFQCNFEIYQCIPRRACVTDQDCYDDDACTVDRCLDQECDIEPVICIDWDPNTTDSCDPGVGCIHTNGCNTSRDCADWDPRTTEECVAGKCVRILEYIHVTTLSRRPEQKGDRVDHIMFNGTGQMIVQTDALPSERFLPIQPICSNGLYIDIYDPGDGCDPDYPLTDIDVWRELDLVNYVLIFDECGERIFVSPENFGCNTLFFSP